MVNTKYKKISKKIGLYLNTTNLLFIYTFYLSNGIIKFISNQYFLANRLKMYIAVTKIYTTKTKYLYMHFHCRIEAEKSRNFYKIYILAYIKIRRKISYPFSDNTERKKVSDVYAEER